MPSLAEVLAAFAGRRALVAGDICLDQWCTYDPDLADPSRETGLARIAVVATEHTPGAGGTIANNLAAMGVGQVAVLGVIGDDAHGWQLRRSLTGRGIQDALLISHPAVQTFTYTKFICAKTGVEDLPRVDFINSNPLPAEAESRLLEALTQAVDQFDVVCVSDQAETNQGGTVTAAMRDRLALLAKQYPQKVFWIDSRLRPELFRGLVLKPNEAEARAACLRAFGVEDFERLRRLTAAPFMIVTQGSRGALVLEKGRQTHAPTRPVAEPVDICGAGDSFSAAAAVAYAITRDALFAAHCGNLAASVTIMKKGTGTASPAEMLEAEARFSR